MNELTVTQSNISANIEDLAKFVLIGRDKLQSVRAEISAISKLGLAKEVYEQKKAEAQDIAETVTLAEMRTGELLKAIPKATTNNPLGKNQHSGQNDTNVDLTKTTTMHKPKREVIKDLGFSPKQAERMQTLAENPEIVKEAIQKARDNDDIVSRAFIMGEIKQAKREEKAQEQEERRAENAAKVETLATPLEAQGLFQTIVIDPPWDWGDEGDMNQMGRARPEYATMPIDEIKALPISKIADDNCHLYLWVTNRSLPKAFSLVEAWGFRYITCLTWVKPSFGMGNYFRGSTEQVIFAVKGSQPLKRRDVGTHFNAPRGEGGHSAKPDEFYKLVETCSYAPYIDVFGRKKRDGWALWGENG